MNELSKIVKQHRKKAGLTQKELADLAGVGKTVVFDVEKNKDTVQINTVLKILSALNIKISFDSPIELGDAQ
ncbi:MAG: type II toxin-antitoxin system Y4mF family antitoxin [Bacteroidetes bacterium]|nr:type II toxin-antitoxin system Y4mF family antitoxin [Bacteroidota bacterium]MBU2508115.1 type II toxin-antitoxin system Y4mF family antitoxin [Bacteroidota bacterium]